jgi:hypothetical protein
MHRIESRYQSPEEVPVRNGSILLLPGNTSILANKVESFRFDRYKRMAYDDVSKNYEPFTLLTPALQRKFASKERTEAVSLLHALQSEMNQLQQPETLLGVVKMLIDRKAIAKAETYLQTAEGVLKRTYKLLKGMSTFLDQIAPLYNRFQDDDVIKTLCNIREGVDRFTKLKDTTHQAELREQLVQLKQQITEAKAATTA